jgi:hypothetical protein
MKGALIGAAFGCLVTWLRWHDGQGLHLWQVAAGAALGFLGERLAGTNRGPT